MKRLIYIVSLLSVSTVLADINCAGVDFSEGCENGAIVKCVYGAKYVTQPATAQLTCVVGADGKATFDWADWTEEKKQINSAASSSSSSSIAPVSSVSASSKASGTVKSAATGTGGSSDDASTSNASDSDEIAGMSKTAFVFVVAGIIIAVFGGIALVAYMNRRRRQRRDGVVGSVYGEMVGSLKGNPLYRESTVTSVSSDGSSTVRSQPPLLTSIPPAPTVSPTGSDRLNANKPVPVVPVPIVSNNRVSALSASSSGSPATPNKRHTIISLTDPSEYNLRPASGISLSSDDVLEQNDNESLRNSGFSQTKNNRMSRVVDPKYLSISSTQSSNMGTYSAYRGGPPQKR